MNETVLYEEYFPAQYEKHPVLTQYFRQDFSNVDYTVMTANRSHNKKSILLIDQKLNKYEQFHMLMTDQDWHVLQNCVTETIFSVCVAYIYLSFWTLYKYSYIM